VGHALSREGQVRDLQDSGEPNVFDRAQRSVPRPSLASFLEATKQTVPSAKTGCPIGDKGLSRAIQTWISKGGWSGFAGFLRPLESKPHPRSQSVWN
jgi:hypothetical protein